MLLFSVLLYAALVTIRKSVSYQPNFFLFICHFMTFFFINSEAYIANRQNGFVVFIA